jgi:hypothetical protein
METPRHAVVRLSADGACVSLGGERTRCVAVTGIGVVSPMGSHLAILGQPTALTEAFAPNNL